MTWPVELAEVLEKIIAFRDARNWQQFHSIKNLLIALSIESAEILELIQWKSDAEISNDARYGKKFRSDLQKGNYILESLAFSTYIKGQKSEENHE